MNYLFLSGDNVATVNEALVPHFMGLQQEALLKLADATGKAVKDSVQVDIDQLYDFRDEVIGPGGASIVGITDLGGYYTATTVEGALQELASDLGTAWGEITGTLSNQGDLQGALNSKQAADAALTSISGLATIANNGIYTIAPDTYATYTLSSFARSMLAEADAPSVRTTLGLGTAATAASTAFQAADAGLASIAGLTTLADRSIYTTASDTYATYTLTAFARTILDDANAAAVRTTIGAGTGNGTVTTMSIVTANGVSGSVATATTTPAVTLTLGAITPSSVAATGFVSGVGPITATGASGGMFFANRTGTARLYAWYGDTNTIRLNVSGFGDVWSVTETGSLTIGAGTFTDQYGKLRAVPITDQNATYTFVAADNGRARRKTNSTAYTYTVDSVHAAGDVLSVINNNGTGNITIAQGAGVTLRLAGTATTGNRTVAPHGYATIYMMSSTEGYVSGPGVT